MKISRKKRRLPLPLSWAILFFHIFQTPSSHFSCFPFFFFALHFSNGKDLFSFYSFIIIFFFSSVLVWNFSVFDFFFFFKKTKYAKKHWEDKSKVNREGGGAVAEQAGDLHFSWTLRSFLLSFLSSIFDFLSALCYSIQKWNPWDFSTSMSGSSKHFRWWDPLKDSLNFRFPMLIRMDILSHVVVKKAEKTGAGEEER